MTAEAEPGLLAASAGVWQAIAAVDPWRPRQSLRRFGRASESLSEAIAAVVLGVMGTVAFVVLQNLAIGWWCWENTAGGATFDPYPFILLNLVLSLQAAQTGPLVLIANRRTERIINRLLHRIDAHATHTHAAIFRVETGQAALHSEVAAMRTQLDRVEKLLLRHGA